MDRLYANTKFHINFGASSPMYINFTVLFTALSPLTMKTDSFEL